MFLVFLQELRDEAAQNVSGCVRAGPIKPRQNLASSKSRSEMDAPGDAYVFLANFHLILEIGGAIFSMALLQFAMHRD